MAAQNVSGSVQVNVNMTELITSGFPNTLSSTAQISFQQALAFATGATGSTDSLYAFSGSLAAAAKHVNLNSITDLFGNSQAMARARFFIVQNVTTTAAFLCNVYTRSGTNPVTWLPQVTTATYWCPPGGILVGVDGLSTSTNGWVVSSGANDFTLDPGANTITVNVVVGGNTAA